MSEALDALAPYPRREEDVTAAELARYVAVRAYVRDATIVAPNDGMSPAELRESATAMRAFLSDFALVSLLRDLADGHPEFADEVARKVWLCWQDGGVMPELLWDWLTEYRIDPEVVSRLAAEQRAEQAV